MKRLASSGDRSINQASLNPALHPRHGKAQSGLCGRHLAAYPVLDLASVRRELQRLRAEGMEPLPLDAAAWRSFQALGHCPEVFLRPPDLLQRRGLEHRQPPPQPCAAGQVNKLAAQPRLRPGHGLRPGGPQPQPRLSLPGAGAGSGADGQRQGHCLAPGRGTIHQRSAHPPSTSRAG